MTCLLATALLLAACGGGDPDVPLVADAHAKAAAAQRGSGGQAMDRSITPTEDAIIDPSDRIAELSASAPLHSQTWSNINCYGQYGPLSKLRPNGIHGTPLPDGSTLRFGHAADELDPSRKVLAFRVASGDPLTAGALRCEALAPPTATTALPVGQELWYAISLRVTDGRISTGDDQLLTQWHQAGFPPFMALYLKDGHLRLQIRYNANDPALPGSSSTLTPWVDGSPVTDRWMTFVVNARISPFSGDKPFIKVWRDGYPLVDHTGPLGYNAKGYSYVKTGIYHWLDSGNQWDPRAPVKTMFVNRALLVRGSGYSEQLLRKSVQ